MIQGKEAQLIYSYGGIVQPPHMEGQMNSNGTQASRYNRSLAHAVDLSIHLLARRQAAYGESAQPIASPEKPPPISITG